MILHYQKIELLEKTVFERIQFNPPLKASEFMDNEACLIYSVNGHSQLYGGVNTEALAPDESVLMKCGNFVNNWHVSEQTDPYEAIAIHFYPGVIEQIFEHNIPDYLTTPVGNRTRVFQKIEQNSILTSYIHSLLMYFENPELFNTDTIKLKLRELIALLYSLNSNGIRELLSDLFNPSQLEFKKVIAEHIYHELTLDDYAMLLNMSVSTFKRKFNELYGTSPRQYILSQRLEKAAHVLRTSSTRITDVCFTCGFGDLSNFTKAFSKKYGQSPSEYQKQALS